MQLEGGDKVLLLASLATAVVGGALIGVGCFLRFGNGFSTFSNYAQKDDDFLELKRLDMVFGLFVAAAGILILSFFLVTYATIRRNRFLLYAYCGMIALMVVVQLVAGLLSFNYSDQINQLASADVLYESLGKAAVLVRGKTTLPGDDEVQFWAHAQGNLGCCGVFSNNDWKNASLSDAEVKLTNCFGPHFNDGCEKRIRSRISQDAQFFGAASMGVLVVEVVASFLAGYRAYNLAHPEFSEKI